MKISELKRSPLFLVLLIAVSFCFASAGHGKDNGKRGPVLTVHGNVDAGYPAAHDAFKKAAAKPAKGAGTIVDTVMAVPVRGGNLDSSSMVDSKSVPIKPGGEFSISLEKDRDWLLVLMNSAASGAARFAGQIAFQIGDPSNTLLLLPVSTAVISKLNIGKVVASGDMGIARKKIDAADFSLTPAQLAALAQNDDRFANVRNLVINFDPTTDVFYTLRPDFFWPGNYAEIQGAFPIPDLYAYRGYNFQLDSNSTELTIGQVCGASKVSVELFPPAGTTVEARNPQMPADDTIPAAYRTYNDATPIANDGAVCSIAADGSVEVTEPVNGDFFATDRYGDISYTFGIDLLTDPIPAGSWTYKVGGVERAQFDFSSPVFAPRTPEGKVNGIAPVIRVNTDAAGMIASIDVRWYEYNSVTGMYDEITDLSALQYLIGSADIFFDNSSTGPRRYESVNFDPATQTSVAPANTWYYGYEGAAGEQTESIGVFYSSAGLGYFFTYERFVYPIGDPSFVLPVPARYTAYSGPAPVTAPDPCIRPENLSFVTRGQQFNSCYSSVTHTGLDFGFDWPVPPAPPLFREIVAPCDGVVTSVSRNYFVNGYDVGIQCSRTWGTYLAFEPCNPDAAILDMQKTEIELAVYVNQVVRQGQRIGRLVVSEAMPGCFGPHVHWGVGRTDMMTWTDVCPRDYSTVEAQTQLDDLYSRLCGMYGWLLPPCLPPPPPECHPLP